MSYGEHNLAFNGNQVLLPGMLVSRGIVERPDGMVALVRVPERKRQGGLWEPPGGKIEADGRSVVENAAREVWEEIGVQAVSHGVLSDFMDIAVRPMDDLGLDHVTVTVGLQVVGNPDMDLDGLEHTEGMWVDPRAALGELPLTHAGASALTAWVLAQEQL